MESSPNSRSKDGSIKKDSRSKMSSNTSKKSDFLDTDVEPLSGHSKSVSIQGKSGSNQTDTSKNTDSSRKTPSKSILQERIDLYKVNIEENELNLRRNIILGGVFYFDLLEIPPQPKKVGDWIICQLETPQALKTVSWKADYKKPNTDEGANSNNAVTKKTPEEIEREIKEQEMELQKLVLVYLKLPSSALWFEPPTIVRWESEKGYWSTNGFYDIKFDEGKQTLSFRTLSFGIFALSAFRYSNLPLQSWELKPESENSALITLSAAAVQAEFLIGEGVITLKKFSCGNKPPVKGLQDKPMAVKDLIKEMRMQGVDIFPDYDSHCYIEGLPLKDIQTERHLYNCIALTANSYNYSWSRWNLLSGYEKLIMQHRERLPGKQEGSFEVILVTPEKTSVLECTEASQTFNDKPIENFENFPDLYSMILDVAPEPVLKQMEKAKAVFVHTVSQMLLSSKVLSYA
uniref:Cancer susceptibility candidate protein 1 homolog [Apis mellifera] n=1 Tax=Lepeophtheirus salmonis TaxID=72036 RepID=A0A0K2TFR8_LEPSM